MTKPKVVQLQKDRSERPNRIEDTRTDLLSCGCNGSGFRYFQEWNDGSQQYVNWTEVCDCSLKASFDHRVGKKFAGCTFETYKPGNPIQQVALNTIKDDPAGSYYLYGDYGAGKTHLLVAQYRHFALRSLMARYRRAVELKDQMIAEVMDEDRTGGGFSLVAEVRSHDVTRLFIDDLDKLKFTDFLREQMFALFDALDQEDSAISITSNVPLETLEGIIGGREGKAIGARIERLCRVLEVRL